MRGKKILGLAAIIAGLLTTSCEELENMFDEFGVKVNSEYYTVELAIPPAPAGMQVYVHTLMQSDLDQIIEEYGDATATLQKVEVTEAYIEVMDRSKVKDLNAVKSVTTTLSTENLTEVTIASVINDAREAIMLPMEIHETDITDYVDTEEYILTNYGELQETLTDTLWVRGKMRYQLTLNVTTTE